MDTSVWEADEKDAGDRRRLEGKEYAQMRGVWFCLFGIFLWAIHNIPVMRKHVTSLSVRKN